jgi:hypothetical protein
VPAIDIQSVSVQASRRKKSKTDPAEVTAGVSTTIQLAGSDPTNTAILNASLNYESGDWIFHGRLESFQFSVLYSHFPPEVADAFDDVLGKFLVRFVDITYTYAKSDDSGKPRAASSFFISGAIEDLNLTLPTNMSATSPAVVRVRPQGRLFRMQPRLQIPTVMSFLQGSRFLRPPRAPLQRLGNSMFGSVQYLELKGTRVQQLAPSWME